MMHREDGILSPFYWIIVVYSGFVNWFLEKANKLRAYLANTALDLTAPFC